MSSSVSFVGVVVVVVVTGTGERPKRAAGLNPAGEGKEGLSTPKMATKGQSDSRSRRFVLRGVGQRSESCIYRRVTERNGSKGKAQ